jgi:hypothetical protein
MSVQVISVPVPTSGDGAAVSIANLVGEKSVILTGLFAGQYVILAGHEAGELVPVLQFDAGGEAGVQQTLPDAYQYVAVRAQPNTSPVGTAVTVNVAGVVGAGQNYFATLATLNQGSMGPQASIDTWSLFPPTGIEKGISIICRGFFTGNIIVEGSTDNVNWNPIGQFVTTPMGRTLLGNTQVLEFGPLPTEDLVRYIRANVAGTILGPTVLTIGGQVPASGTGPTGTNVAIVTSSTLQQGYFFTGTLGTGPIYTDALGNEVDSTAFPFPSAPADIVCVGSNNSIVAAGGPIVVIGTDLNAQGDEVICIGSAPGESGGIAVGETSNFAIVIGAYNSVNYSGGTFNQLLGNFLTLNGEGSSSNTLIGEFLSCGETSLDTGNNVLIGSNIGSGDSAFGNVLIIAESSGGTTLPSGSQYNTLIGGNGLFASTSDIEDCILLGNVCNLTNGTTPNGYTQDIYLIGTFCYAEVTGLADVGGNLFGSIVVLGTTIRVVNANAGAAFASKAVAIGESINLQAVKFVSSVGATNNFSQVVLIGSNMSATALTGESDQSSHIIQIGDSIVSGIPDGSGTGLYYLHILGSNITVEDGSSHVVVVGDTFTAAGIANDGVFIGQSHTNTETSSDTVSIGHNNFVNIATTNIVTIGNFNSIYGYTPAAGSNIILIGYSNVAEPADPNITNFDRIVLIGCEVDAENINESGTTNLTKIVGIGDSLLIETSTGGAAFNQNINQVVAIGSSISCYATLASLIDLSSHVVLVGDQITVGVGEGSSNVGASYVQAIGSLISIPDRSPHLAVLGDTITFSTGGSTDCVAVGQSLFLGGTDNTAISNTVATGSNISIGCASSIVAIGNSITIPGNLPAPAANIIAIGFSIDLAGNYGFGGIAIGDSAAIAPGGYSIAIGSYASAAIGQCVIGASTGSSGFKPIHQFIVRGLTTGSVAVDTINANDGPAAGSSGLSVVYNESGTLSNKTLKAAASPPGGSLIAYFDP